MLETSVPTQGLLFGSFLFRNDIHSEESLTSFWESHFGKSFSLIPADNPLAGYYSREMGEDLSRIFFLTSETYPREFLLTSKLQAIEWERKWARDGKRMVNVDTGLLSLENFQLATTKNYSHRVYLGQNIFADLTYQFHQGDIQTFPWTYPDYLDSQKKDFFLWGRSFLHQSLSK
jgi:hypothetical protein